MSEGRIIKRYANRKLYDTQHSRYVTLEQIAEMIRGGDDVTIVDNKTKEDLTSVTLAQIIFEEEKKQKSFLPLQAMRNIIQSGSQSITHLVSEAQRRVTSMLPLKRDTDASNANEDGIDAGSVRADNGSSSTPIEDFEPLGGVRRSRDGLTNLREFRDWIVHSHHTIDEWQRKVDGRIRTVVEGISPFASLHKEVHGLASRIAQLEERLAQLAETEYDNPADTE